MKEEEINQRIESVAPALDSLTPVFRNLNEDGVDAGFLVVGGAELDDNGLYRTVIHIGGSKRAVEAALCDACEKIPDLLGTLLKVVVKSAKKTKSAKVIPLAFNRNNNNLKN